MALITVRFNAPAFYSDGTNGVSITNETTGDTFTIGNVSGHGTTQLAYTGGWNNDIPRYGDQILYSYSGTEYMDSLGSLMPAQQLSLVNCSEELTCTLTFDGLSKATLSVPLTFAGSSEISIGCSSGGGIEQALLDADYKVTTLNKFDVPAECTDIKVNGVSVGTTGDFPADGLLHTIKFTLPTGMAEKTIIGETWQGEITKVAMNDLVTPDNSVVWKLNSGPPDNTVGTEVSPNADFNTTEYWTPDASRNTLWEITSPGIGRVTNGNPEYCRISTSMSVVVGKTYEIVPVFGANGGGSPGLRLTVGTTLFGGEYSSNVTGKCAFTATTDTLYLFLHTGTTTVDAWAEIDTLSVKEYIWTSDGTVVEPSEEDPIQDNIFRPDEWVPSTGITALGAFVTFSGTQAPWAAASMNSGETYTGLHAITFMVSNATQGYCRVSMGATPSYAGVQKGLFTVYQNPTAPTTIFVQDYGSDGDRFNGKVEIISINPAPNGLFYTDVDDTDWSC